ncbi:DUF2461 domain-containing protein [Hymenobacter sp. YC55]|uniref:DUF2461 domain-containing protein n=1 Tax=Hymenobacter sp. YC55 TaxID=3034019 RepID=UPI0023F82C61|nr:DUF2461 domain-containing protein [Hymenobacter sp. YC55]MDF7810351.1 DUF2461 domain-containing protein [Hymenobacter sp. YC55]
MDRTFLLDFLRNLAANNHKAWMDDNRAAYNQARAIYTALIQEVLTGLQEFDPDLRALTPADVMFRINKNDRSQRDPEPYKRRMGAGMKRDGRHAPWAGYFLAVQPEGHTWMGAGVWKPDTTALTRIRQEIYYNGAEFQTLREDPQLLHYFPAGLQGERLQRPPRGYNQQTPDLEWLRLKEFRVSQTFPDSEVLRPDFAARVVTGLRTTLPLVRFLNQAMSAEN